MNVLSLFDGMSCGRIALERAGIQVDEYMASEIDKHAMIVSNANYPDIQQLGDITKLTRSQLLDLPRPDLIIGGSPCQGFSLAGKMKGSRTKEGVEVVSLAQYLELKELGFEFDGQSYLFWEYVRVLRILKPKYFLLENVRVTKKWLPMFNTAMGVDPVMINSRLVSAQNRVRYYWTNIPGIEQPEDRNITLSDILLDEVDINIKYVKKIISTPPPLIVNEATKKGFIEVVDGGCFDGSIPDSKTRRGRQMITKSNALVTSCMFMRYGHPFIIKFTPIECERLQTVPDNYTNHVSDNQRYKILGNGWTVDVIAHILKYI